MMQVKDVMSREIITVGEKTPLAQALSKMVTNRISCLIVTRENRPVGIITERDATREFVELLNHGQIIALTVNDVMTPNPLCVSGEDEFADALVLSRSRHLRHLPVVDNDEVLVGMVTQSNLVDAYAQLMERHNELEDDLEEMRLLSLEDPLLGIGNRRAMEVDLSYTESEARRHNKVFAVCLLDIDFFKLYNDHYGHQEGDVALAKVAQAVKASLRDSDRVYRYGGEEILALMPETNLEAAKIAGERARAAVEALDIPHVHSTHKKLTVSGGLAAAPQGKWEELVAKADEGLYEAKGQGKNRIVAL